MLYRIFLFLKQKEKRKTKKSNELEVKVNFLKERNHTYYYIIHIINKQPPTGNKQTNNHSVRTLMKLLSQPFIPAGQSISTLSSPSNCHQAMTISALTSPSPEITVHGDDKVHVAVGKSLDKAVSLLKWSINRFENHEICILHVHQPSPFIPTLRKSSTHTLNVFE